jgi:TonB-dependent SusC/RagA subfamily outer membrane receptor
MLLAFTVGEVSAQESGTIRGSVVHDATLQPAIGAQVSVVGTSRGALTNASGQFLILNVPTGTHTLRVDMMGYSTLERTVEVSAGDVIQLDLEISTEAISLDELVVTGQPGATKRRAIGTSVASIEVSERVAEAPVTDLHQLLQGADAGITTLGASGTAGGANSLVLRGATSMMQDNAPLIYVDGVRLDTDQESLIYLGGQTTSRVNDLNPADIERVEVIKGAAATALYGTEASNGVIQIFTKKGRPGESVFQVSTKLGGTRIPSVFPLMHPDSRYPSANDLLKTGFHREGNISLRGGSETMTHYVSANYMNTEGSFINNYFERAGGRLNLGLMPSDQITVDLTSNLTWSRARLPYNDNYIYGVLTTLLLGNPVTKATPTDPYGGAFIPVTYATEIENIDETYHFTGGLTLQHHPSESFNHKVTLGIESVHGMGTSVWPYAPNNARPEGSREANTRQNLQFNFDYAGSWVASLNENFESTLSAGAQVFTLQDHRVYSEGQKFAAPGLQLTGALTDLIDIGESELKYSTGGLFVQEQLAFKDKLFLIAGLRVDGSSAFGENFGLQVYPKSSVSYVISDEEWFDLPGVNTLRLRGGFGMAGTQPGAFDAVRTYGPFTAVGGQPAIHAVNLGNPDLAPEVSFEWEGGFDAGLLDQRLSLDANFYYQTTRDALLRRTYPPSLGFLQTQLTNLGRLRNTGLELSADATIMEGSGFTWKANAAYAFNSNEVLDMGGTPFIQIDRFGTRVEEGYPVGGKWEYVTVGTDADGFPIASDEPVYLGPSFPPHTGSFGTQLTRGSFRVFAHSQFAAGHVVNNMNRPYMVRLKTGEEYFETVIANNDDPVDPQSDAVKILQAKSRIFGDFIEDADWWKLREVGISYSLPQNLVGPVGADFGRVTLTGRNLLTLTGYSGTDPETSSTYQSGSLSVGADFFTVPQARQLMLVLDFRF